MVDLKLVETPYLQAPVRACKFGLFIKLSLVAMFITIHHLQKTSIVEVARNDSPDFRVPWHVYMPLS